MKIYTCKNGSTIVEMIIVLGIIMVVLTGLMTTSINALRASQSNKMKTKATDLVQRALEELKNERDVNWDGFKSNLTGGTGGIYCLTAIPITEKATQLISLPSSPSPVPPTECLYSGYTYAGDAKFAIKATYTNPGTNIIRIRVDVSWMDKTLKNTTLVTDVTNWR